MNWTFKREEEEAIIRRRLLYEGHGSGEDKKLLSVIRGVTRLCLCDDNGEDLQKLVNTITKDIACGLNAAEKMEKVSQMYDRSFMILEKALEDKAIEVQSIHGELAKLQLELEYVEKLKRVNAYPDCQTTELAMREINKKKDLLLRKTERLKENINIIMSACASLQKVMNDEMNLMGSSESSSEMVT